MPSAFRHQNQARWIIGATVTASTLLAVFYYRAWITAPTMPDESAKPPQPMAVEPLGVHQAITGQVWMALQARPDPSSGSVAIPAAPDRFRLAGTFFIEGAGEPQRKAILDDTAKRDQFIVSEGEQIDDVTVIKIFFDHVILQTPAGTREIWVEFASPAQPLLQSALSNQVAGAVGMTNKFGCVQINENRWKFSRKPILDYYQELLDEPDRMVAVFDTMKPVRNERNKITGYVVGIEGEKAFFDAVGLQQGDIVRSVNSLPMTNRRRAEAFIDQFLKDKMNAVVIEVERGGKRTKQVYQLSQ